MDRAWRTGKSKTPESSDSERVWPAPFGEARISRCRSRFPFRLRHLRGPNKRLHVGLLNCGYISSAARCPLYIRIVTKTCRSFQEITDLTNRRLCFSLPNASSLWSSSNRALPRKAQFARMVWRFGAAFIAALAAVEFSLTPIAVTMCR